MTEATPFLQNTILLSYDPRLSRRGLFVSFSSFSHKCKGSCGTGAAGRAALGAARIKGDTLFREREYPPYCAHCGTQGTKCRAPRCQKSRLSAKKKERLFRGVLLIFTKVKIYRYFCMPSVARAGSPETEMVNLTPVALLKRSSSFRKSSAAWLHSPPVILNRLSMKMWEIS